MLDLCYLRCNFMMMLFIYIYIYMLVWICDAKVFKMFTYISIIGKELSVSLQSSKFFLSFFVSIVSRHS